MKPACRKAVILAAGCGSRVRSITEARPKCLMDLAGRPIIQWILDGLRQAGIEEVVVVTGYRPGYIKHALRHRKPAIRYVHNPRWRLPNGLSLYAARRAVREGERFLVLMSDHLLSTGIIRDVARARTPGCVLAVDTRIGEVFDISDATKVRIENGKPVAIGKRLRKYNAVDCGLFRFDSRVFAALRAASRSGDMSLSGGVRRLIAAGELTVLPIARGTRWLDIDTPRAYRHAAKIVESLTGDPKPGRR
jgi:choline kinase